MLKGYVKAIQPARADGSALDLARRRLADPKRRHRHRGRREDVVALEEAIELRPQRVTANGRTGDLLRRHPPARLDQRDQARVHPRPVPLQVVAQGGREPRVPEGVGHLGGILEARVRVLHGPAERGEAAGGGAGHPLHFGVDGRVPEPGLQATRRCAGGRASARV